ncbi:MAG: Rieske 2Fe-2S domain-containing protein [Chloroflexi bacterium]|nr:Rieske 2Fe-2S domain-containing protein [Chloroflexota bacterium]
MANLSRRDLLKISAQALLGLSAMLGISGIIRFLSFEPDPPPPQQFEVGSTSDFLPDTRTIIKTIPAVLIRSSNGFNALSLTCQHLGCTVESKSDGFTCPCHGSRYKPNGQLIQGPSDKGLKSLRVEISSADKVIIFKS